MRGAVFEIHLPPGVRAGQRHASASRARTSEGHAPKSSLQAFLPNREITADRAVVEWVVRAPRGTRDRR
ncbi:MAG: hypothetical protein MZW92_04600 [Comamonadaceae bacterium]|nr:hypothetical protein [Comamonadaceae bacterium]